MCVCVCVCAQVQWASDILLFMYNLLELLISVKMFCTGGMQAEESNTLLLFPAQQKVTIKGTKSLTCLKNIIPDGLTVCGIHMFRSEFVN